MGQCVYISKIKILKTFLHKQKSLESWKSWKAVWKTAVNEGEINEGENKNINVKYEFE